MKKLASLVLALVLSLGLCVPALAAEFSDVPASHPFYDAIADCSEKGIVGGYSDGTFQPANAVMKNHFCAMLARAFYPDTVAKYSSDYIKTTYGTFGPTNRALAAEKILANASFQWAYDDASVMGTGINRCDMAQLMTNIMAQKGFAASESDKNDAASKIADYADIPSQYRDAVLNVYALGIIGGYSDGTFGGGFTMNRGQAAVVIYRLAQYVGDGSGTGPAVPAGYDPANVPNSPASAPAGQEASGNAENETLTLRDGSAPTEENARRILETVMAAYPGEDWTANSQRSNTTTFNGNQLGTMSTAMQEVGKQLQASMYGGCGGLASMASDAIFGGGSTGGENFPVRKLDSVTDVRVGDVYIHFDKTGHPTHVAVVASVGETLSVTDSRKILQRITKYDGGGNGGVTDAIATLFEGTHNGGYCEVYTRYPD